jgi:hypothetical protein
MVVELRIERPVCLFLLWETRRRFFRYTELRLRLRRVSRKAVLNNQDVSLSNGSDGNRQDSELNRDGDRRKAEMYGKNEAYEKCCLPL